MLYLGKVHIAPRIREELRGVLVTGGQVVAGEVAFTNDGHGVWLCVAVGDVNSGRADCRLENVGPVAGLYRCSEQHCGDQPTLPSLHSSARSRTPAPARLSQTRGHVQGSTMKAGDDELCVTLVHFQTVHERLSKYTKRMLTIPSVHVSEAHVQARPFQ